jgi:hypothetical protein
MGCVPLDDECNDDEEPRHMVRLTRPFDLMTTEVTLGMLRMYGRRRETRFRISSTGIRMRAREPPAFAVDVF